MPKSIKLKNCPFCKGKAYLIQRANKLWDVGCKTLCCVCWICTDKKCESCSDGYVDKDDVIKAWNTR